MAEKNLGGRGRPVAIFVSEIQALAREANAKSKFLITNLFIIKLRLKKAFYFH